MTTAPRSEEIAAVSLGELDLSGLDLVSLDLDELAQLADSTRRDSMSVTAPSEKANQGKGPLSPPDAFRSAATQRKNLALKAKKSYCESLTSDDGSGQGRVSGSWSASSQSSFASKSSWSSSLSSRSYASSNGSGRSNRSGGSGKALIALGLGAAEVIAISVNKNKNRKQHLSNSNEKTGASGRNKAKGRAKLTETKSANCAEKTPARADALRQVHYNQLTADELDWLRSQLPGLSKSASLNLQSLLIRYSVSHQHKMKRLMRRFEYEFRARKIGGSRKLRRSGERVPVRLGEFMSKYIFMPKTRHLQKNGDLLFLKLFNLFSKGRWDDISLLKKKGFALVRETLQETQDPWLDGISKGEDVSLGSSSARSRSGNKRDSRRSHRRNRAQHKQRRHGKEKPTTQNRKSPESNPVNDIGLTRLPEHFEGWVDEDGVKVWRDKKRNITFNSEALRNPNADPYALWSRIIDSSGRTLYLQESTDEALIGDDSQQETERASSPVDKRSTARPTQSRKKSMTSRAMRKISKWISGRARPQQERDVSEYGRSRSAQEIVLQVKP